MLLKGTGSFLTTFFNSLCVFVGTGSSSEFLRAASDFQHDHLAPGAGPALCRIEIFWFTHVRFSRLQMAKKSHQREHDRFLKAQYSPCLPFPGVLPVTFRFLSLSQLEDFFPLKNTHTGRKKKNPSSNVYNHRHNLLQFGFGAFSLVLAQIFWLNFHSFSASLIFTYTLMRFFPHFLQHAALDYQGPLLDIYICPMCLQQTSAQRSKPLYQKYFSWLSFLLLPSWSSLDHGVALLPSVELFHAKVHLSLDKSAVCHKSTPSSPKM